MLRSGKECLILENKTLIATPSYSHMAIAQLLKYNLVEHLISQNIDDLHLKSGVPFDKLTELHGNVFIEACGKCNTSYRRSYRTRVAEDKQHKTGRKWEQPNCDGELNDTLVLFGESIPKHKIETSLGLASTSQLWICIGSSLIVKPAISFPYIVKKNGGKLVVVNMEKTPFDEICDVRFGGDCDMTLKHLMHALQIQVPDYYEENSVKIARNAEFIEIQPANLNNSEIKKVEFLSTNDKAEVTTEIQPYRFEVTSTTSHCQVRLHFAQENKSPLEIEFYLENLESEVHNVVAKFNSSQNKWISTEFLNE